MPRRIVALFVVCGCGEASDHAPSPAVRLDSAGVSVVRNDPARPINTRHGSVVRLDTTVFRAPPPPGGVRRELPPNSARDARRLDYIPAVHFEEAVKRLAKSDVAMGAPVFTAPDKQTAYLLIRRTVPSEIEEHSRWDDILVVRSGRGIVRFGSKVSGARLEAAGELRGGAFVASAGEDNRGEPWELELSPGDVARIPAGVAHAFVPLGPDPFEFLLVKVRRPDKPLKTEASP